MMMMMMNSFVRSVFIVVNIIVVRLFVREWMTPMNKCFVVNLTTIPK